MKNNKVKTFWSDFKKFISKGNVVDLAVAVVIGAAFNKIISSLVNDIIMPLISLAVGGADVTDWKWVIKEAVYDPTTNALITAETSLNYGVFIQTIIDFLIIAFTLFVAIKIFTASSRRLEKLGEDVKRLGKKGKHSLETEEVNEKEEPVVTQEVVEETKQENNQNQESIELLKEIRDLLKSEKAEK